MDLAINRSKHIVTKKIDDNVGIFDLPSIATYVIKGHVWKLGAWVVEDVIDERLKIRFVYVVRGITTTPAFVKVMDIKVYSYVFAILNINC